MMMMIGELNASHTGVTGGGRTAIARRSRPATPASTSSPTRRASIASATSTRTVRRIATILKVARGHYVIAVDDHALKTADNYWRNLTPAPGSKLHFVLNDKPAKDGAWTVSISPVAGGAFTDLQYAQVVANRRAIVGKFSKGEIGYLHIRAMDAPSLRQFQLDLAANRTGRRSSSTSASTAAAASIRSCSASSPGGSIGTRSDATPASSCRGRRTSTDRWS